MFYILMVAGITFIILGVSFNRKNAKFNKGAEEDLFLDEIYNENIENLRRNIKQGDKTSKGAQSNREDEVELLELRLEKLEKMLFKQLLEKETNKAIVVEEREEVQESAGEKDALEKYKLIRMYEGQNKTIDEIAALLDMNKGEVILLKNLYKNS